MSRLRMMFFSGVAASVAFPAVWLLLASERPVGGDLLKLTDPPSESAQSAQFRAGNDPAVDLRTLADPREVGALLRLWGGSPGDGDSSLISLPKEKWTGLGRPPGSKGYVFRDPAAAAGVRRVAIESAAAGGSLTIKAGGPAWPYRVTQPQGLVTLTLQVGDDTFCARFSEFARNEARLVIAKKSESPVSCQPEACGNAILETAEDCDDGNNLDGDGCNAACQLESATALCAGVPTTQSTQLALQKITGELDHPVHLAAPALDVHRLFVVEQPGRIRIVKNGVLLEKPFLDIREFVGYGGERGLLSVAFHPNYAQNGRFFVNYTDTDSRTTIARFTRNSDDPDEADKASRVTLLTIDQPYANHNGGQLAFGADGMLYCGMGDGGSANDPLEASQSDTQLLGKMLRLDVGVDAPPYYKVPSDNPNAAAGLRLGLIWSKGLRNPWRFSFDRSNGDLYVADVGQDQFEEIDWRPRSSRGGENYGWDIFEGNACFEPQPLFPNCPSKQGYSMPVHVFGHSNGACSVTGGHVYRGCRMPALRGRYFFSDYCAAFLQSFKMQNGQATDLQDHSASARGLERVSSFGEDARGEIYVLNLGGELFKIVPR